MYLVFDIEMMSNKAAREAMILLSNPQSMHTVSVTECIRDAIQTAVVDLVLSTGFMNARIEFSPSLLKPDEQWWLTQKQKQELSATHAIVFGSRAPTSQPTPVPVMPYVFPKNVLLMDVTVTQGLTNRSPEQRKRDFWNMHTYVNDYFYQCVTQEFSSDWKQDMFWNDNANAYGDKNFHVIGVHASKISPTLLHFTLEMKFEAERQTTSFIEYVFSCVKYL